MSREEESQDAGDEMGSFIEEDEEKAESKAQTGLTAAGMISQGHHILQETDLHSSQNYHLGRFFWILTKTKE